MGCRGKGINHSTVCMTNNAESHTKFVFVGLGPANIWPHMLEGQFCFEMHDSVMDGISLL